MNYLWILRLLKAYLPSIWNILCAIDLDFVSAKRCTFLRIKENFEMICWYLSPRFSLVFNSRPSCEIFEWTGYSIWIPVLAIKIDSSGCSHYWKVQVKFCGEIGTCRIEVLLGQQSLCVLKIGASQSFNLPFLQGSVLIVEPFRTGSSYCRQICVELELPVTPADQIFVTNLSHLIYLLSATFLSHARTKFSQHKGDSHLCCIRISGSNFVSMEFEAVSSRSRHCRFSIDTKIAPLTAIGVIVQNVIGRIQLATRGNLETDMGYVVDALTASCQELGRFKPHLRIGIMRGPFIVDRSISGIQMFTVHHSWNIKGQITNIVCWVWFV